MTSGPTPDDGGRTPWLLVWWWVRRGLGLHALATLGLVCGALLAPVLGLASEETALRAPFDLLGWALGVLPVVAGAWVVFGLLAAACHLGTAGSDLALVIASGASGAVVAVLTTLLLRPGWTPGPVATALVVLVVGVGFGAWSLYDREQLEHG